MMNFNKDADKDYCKSVYYLTYFITFCILLFCAVTFLNPGKVDGYSMYPTFDNGDRTIDISSKYHSYKRGDIVTIQSSVLKKSIIKRIIAVEGDRIEVTTNNKVYLNGELLDEPYINTIPEDYHSPYINLIVPEGKVFVMGDNRGNSVDSRYFGTVSDKEITSIYLFTIK